MIPHSIGGKREKYNAFGPSLSDQPHLRSNFIQCKVPVGPHGTSCPQKTSPISRAMLRHPNQNGRTHALVGATGFTSNTALSRSVITLSWLFLPDSLISLIFCSASLSASSSAFLLPCEC